MQDALDRLDLRWPHTHFADYDAALQKMSDAWVVRQQIPGMVVLSLTDDLAKAHTFLRTFRAQAHFARVPIIALSHEQVTHDELNPTTYDLLDVLTIHDDGLDAAIQTIDGVWSEQVTGSTVDIDRHNMLVLTGDEGLGGMVAEAWTDEDTLPPSIHCVGTATEGLEAYTTQRFDCVVLDDDLPDEDGLTTLECMKHDPEAWHVPVVMLMPTFDAARARRAINIGAADVLPKDGLDTERLRFALYAARQREERLTRARGRERRLEQNLKMMRRQRSHQDRMLAHQAEALEIATSSLRDEETARHELATKLRRTDRLASIGRLARGLANVINNPLSYAMGNLELCRRLLDEDLGEALRHEIQDRETLVMLDEVLSEFDTSMSETLDGMRRVAEVASSLSRFSRIPEDQFSAIDPIHVLETVLQLMKEDLQRSGELQITLHDTPRILAERSGLLQIFTNLLNHLIELREGRTSSLWIRSREIPKGAQFIFEDTGTTLPSHDFDRLFEPNSLQGDDALDEGLALPLVHHLVRELGGDIDANQTPEGGLRFMLTFPNFDSLSTEAVRRITGQFPSVTRTDIAEP